MPYFALRKLPNPDESGQRIPPSKPSRNWIDLSFLQLHVPDAGDDYIYGVFDAQITLVICGSDNFRWVAYAFDDTYFGNDAEDMENGEDDDDTSSETEGDNYLEAELDPYKTFQGDPIASPSNDGLDANKPLWDPREYFLTICNFRMAVIRNEWQNIVRALERSIKGGVCWRIFSSRSYLVSVRTC